MKNYIKLIISILIPLAIGYFSSFFNLNAIPTWYATLNKPFFNPPNWIFGPVWTILYVLIGISIYLVWTSKAKIKSEKQRKKKAYYIFAIQLILNFLWTVLFFGLNLILPALIEIILLWFAILINIIFVYKISKTSSYLLIPYFLWVSFATLLNIYFLILN